MNPVSDPMGIDSELGSLGGDWISYILGVSSDDGSQIGAVDVDLRGMFHQRWNWDDDLAGYASTPGGINTVGADSHLLIPSNALNAVTPREDSGDSSAFNALPDLEGSIHYGVGSQLRGVWGVPREASTSFNLAYLVMPRGSESQLEYAIDVASPTGDLFRFRQGASFPALPPEPVIPIPDPTPIVPAPPVVPQPPVGSQPPAPQPPVVPPTLPEPTAPSLLTWATQLDRSTDFSLPQGFTAYKFGVATSDGSLIGAVDFRLSSQVLQTLVDLDEDGVVDPSPRGLATTGGDSHLLIPENALTMPLSEQVIPDVAPISGDSKFAIGSSLGGAWGLPGNLQTDSADLAYLVVPDGTDVQQLNLNVEVVTRNGDTFFPTNYLKANDFAVLDANGNVLQPAFVHAPPIVEPPPAPLDPPVIIIEEPGAENPEGIPEVVEEIPPVENPGEEPLEPPFTGEVPWTVIDPIQIVAWEPGIFVPTIDWRLYRDPVYIDIDGATPFISYVDYFAFNAEDGDVSSEALVAGQQLDTFLMNASFGRSLSTWTNFATAFGAASVSTPEPSGVVMAALAMLGVACAARTRGN